MNHAHQKDTSTSGFFPRLLQQITPVLLVIAFIAVVYLYFPFRNRLQFDGDEGINLMKASLVMKGYPLYEQIWSDQPPLLTYTLVGAMRLLGTQVNTARFLILLLSAVLLVAAFYTLRKIWGYPHALVGALLIIMLPFYLQLSVSVMVGLPSLTFAVLSLLGVISWHQGRRWIWLVLSALAFSASVLIKLFTGFLIPIILVGLVLGEWTRSRNRPTLRALLSPALIWGAVFSVVTIGAILLWVGPANLTQLYQSHLEGAAIFDNQIFTINYHLRDSLPLLLLSLFGILFTIISRRWLSLYLVFWMSCAYLLLLRHSPVWYHHQLLVTVPAAMLGGVAVGEGLHWALVAIRERHWFRLRNLFALLALLAFALVIYDQVPDVSRRLRSGANWADGPLQGSDLLEEAYQYVEQYAPDTQWMVTDLPMFPYRFDLLVPPNLVVFSTKRFKTDLIAEEELYRTIDAYQPGMVLINKRILGLQPYLDEDYQLVFTRRDLDLFVRNDIYLKRQLAP
jgi:4-amino-4-deoxy-L-arabinose transferase-like glycosyltransferase